MKPNTKKKVSVLDIYFLVSLSSILLTLTINISMHSTYLVYIVIILVLGTIAFGTKRHKKEKAPLEDLWIMALLSAVLYPLVDYFFEAKLDLVTYLTHEAKILATPIYVILYWIFGVLLFGYFYHRIRDLTNKTSLAGLTTGCFAAASTTLVENLFNLMSFYQNTPSKYIIGHIPIYIPIGYFIAFSLLPIYLRNKYLSGLLLYFLTGLSWYVSYITISRVAL